MTSVMVSRIRRQQIAQLIADGKRLDGRGLKDYRSIQIESGIIGKAEGSARVRLGKTEVMVGVKIDVGEPFSDRPNEGVLTTNAEFVPLASPEFEAGPPGEESMELARVVDRGIRESKAIELEKLCIIPGKKVFVIFVDVYVLNHDGNLIDASTLASIVALMNTKIFKYEIKDGEIEKKPGFSPLPLRDIPISVTLASINGILVVDPWLDEEEVMDARLTIAFSKDGRICAIQKGGSGTLSPQQIIEAANIAKEKSEEIREIVVKS
ncbi:MAG: exosome complex protein Rrp42 [Candidatus Bathyarchaeia archaeon]|nr:exosome complex protein Rrp42 [Candidatus Bathyarchaeota archaeon]